MKRLRHSLLLRPLAASLALAFGAPAADAVPPHAAIVVQNCLDHGVGSLRQAVIDNTSGAPIDLTQLACSGITLTTGSINVQRAQLIQGPGAALLTIDGAGLDRVFTQTSTQPLALYGMTIQNGYADSFGGGCVYTAGPLQLNDTVVRGCHASDIASTVTVDGGGVSVHGTLVAIHSAIVDNEARSDLGNVFGGGASVAGSALLDHSTISGNVASGSGSITAAGGINVQGPLTMTYSTVSDNRATGVPNAAGHAAGVRAFYGASITQSTISGNHADGGIGGLQLYGRAGSPNVIVDSTISGNTATAGSGIVASGNTSIKNSTIAFNVETGSPHAGALNISNAFADLESTIVAANTSADGQAQNIGLGPSGSVADGANNLIGPSPSVTLPADTVGGDPKLLPLHDNGGPTKTHALRLGSAAVDAGNTASGYDVDQRGAGFPRVVGAAADIGAFEGVDADSLFYSGFD